MKNRREEWQQLCDQDKAQWPEPVKPETSGNELLKPEHKTLNAAKHRHLGKRLGFEQ